MTNNNNFAADLNYHECLESFAYWNRCIKAAPTDPTADADAVARWSEYATECLMEAIGFASQATNEGA